MWVAWALLGLVGPVVPLLALSRDLVVDWLRQTQALRAGALRRAEAALRPLGRPGPRGLLPAAGLDGVALGTVALGLVRGLALLRQALPGLLLHP